MIRHTDLVPEEYVQGLVDRLSSLDEQLESLPTGDEDAVSRNVRHNLDRRYEALADELIRQLINWHRDSFNVRFFGNGEFEERRAENEFPEKTPQS